MGNIESVHGKVRNFEANERYRLCYKNKHLPCIFTFQHTHPKNWLWFRMGVLKGKNAREVFVSVT